MNPKTHPGRLTLILAIAITTLALYWSTRWAPAAAYNDALIFRSRTESILANRAIYGNVLFEHLPLAAIPMLLAWILGGWISEGAYLAAFGVVMAFVVTMTALVMSRLGESNEEPWVGVRWLGISAPLMPIVLFRVDPLALLFLVLAVLAIIDSRPNRFSVFASLGFLTKGFPLVLAPVVMVVRGWWRHVAPIGAVFLGTLAILFTDDKFMSYRVTEGHHAESLAGAAFGLFRVWTKGEVDISVQAGAYYVPAPGWLGTVFIVGGTLFFLAVLNRSRRCRGTTLKSADLTRLAVAGAIAILIASPLLSTQFILWLTPAFVFTRREVAVGLVLTTLSAWLLLSDKFPMEPLPWFTLASVRNLALVIAGIMLLWEVGRAHQFVVVSRPR